MQNSDYDELENILISLIRKDRALSGDPDAKKALEIVASLAIQLCRDIHDIARYQNGGQ